LLCLWVEYFDPLWRLAWFDLEGRSPSGALLREDTLGFADGSNGLRITNGNFLMVPSYAVVTSTRHDS
jgi:hypothetical protein